VRGLDRASDEGRFYISSFTKDEANALSGSQVTGVLPDDDGEDPLVFIGLNDATGSKMSYYLRYRADVDSRSCTGGTQTLDGSMSLRQTISSTQAQELPESVTGPGEYGTPKGSQLVAVRIYGPTGGAIADAKVDGKKADVETVELDNRPVATLVALLDGPDDVVITWTMRSGPGQVGNGSTIVTPSVLTGDKSSIFDSSCS